MQRRTLRNLLATATATALVLATPFAATAAPSGAGPGGRFTPVTGGPINTDFLPASVDPNRQVKVVVELQGDSVAVSEAKSKRKLSPAERATLRNQLKSQQDKVIPALRGKGATVVSQMQSAINGVGVQVARKDVAALRTVPGVVAVRSVTTYSLDNATSVPYLGTPQVWQDTGRTGTGVKVAVIDTGIDYTHLDLGGPGTAAAWNDAHNNQAAAPKPANGWGVRVKGGWDFVGDAYNANVAGSTPKPDPNPIDCNGHGSHVAGTVGGSGVNADGTRYTGPYDASTPSHPFKVGPGVAPTVDLYALKVFGCAGSTNVVVEAIDWAVANGMDVVNMSLGSPYGTTGDADAVAASNAVAAGVVVVASAGNAGPNPYLVGSPSTGRGVISVAANDSSAGFPGATLTVNGASIEAINANGINPLPAGPLKVVVLPGLGCSVDEYVAAGIRPGGNQIAVTTRGNCARVARAVYAQKAGAAAVIMINNAADLPPYEGPITENPDTGEQYNVTIPLLGVRMTDAPTLRAAQGAELTMVAKQISNPGYQHLASFSSGGARSGDSGLKPSVTAPGVSIVSAGVGTGNGPATISGTSMAAPHVAGVAALAVQSHPGWSASDIASSIVNTADPGRVAGYRLTLGGEGLVSPANAVRASVVARTDPYQVNGVTQYEQTLSFGYAESATTFTGTRTVTLVNHGTSAVTYAASVNASPQSRPAAVTVSPSSVTVPAGGSATVTVQLSMAAAAAGSSLDSNDPFTFREIAGSVVFTASTGTLRVPYLLVPRATTDLAATINGAINPRSGGATVSLTNRKGALPAAAEFFTWGLNDDRGDQVGTYAGYDLRAAGVQSFADGDDQLLVFAVNTWDRYSSAASIELDVNIDTNGDGRADFVVFSADYGLVVNSDPDGRTVVFLHNVATKQTTAMFFAVAPTNSSTIELPVYASDLGLTAQRGTFSYGVVSGTPLDSAWGDEFAGTASYNPWQKAIPDGQQATVAIGGTAQVRLPVDLHWWAQRRPLGVMIVAYDNAAGADEAVLIGAKP